MLTTENLTKRYCNTLAVDDLNLNIKSGELYGFLGPNGAGKTTTIKMLTGIIKPDSGKITVNNIDIAENPIAVKKLFSYVPDRPYIYEKLTLAEFLNFTASVYKLSKKETAEKIDFYTEVFDLKDRKHFLLESFSHGMKQKAVFISAFMTNPELLIIDEPMVGLDPQSAITVKRMLKEFAASGKTVFMSTHSLNVAEELCTRISIINNGKIIGEGDFDYFKKLSNTGGNLEKVFLSCVENERQRRGRCAL